MNTQLSILNKAVSSVSWTTMAMVIAAMTAKRCGCYFLPEWLSAWGLPVLTAGAVGYLTNAVAISLLFRPYAPVRWLCGLQGVIPREQGALAGRIGEIIPDTLLPPEELAAQIGKMLKDYLRNPVLLEDIRNKVNRFAKRYSATTAELLIPHIEIVARDLAADSLTPDNLQTSYDRYISAWLKTPANRQWLTSNIVAELRRRIPEITDIIRDNVRSGAKAYVQEEYPTWSNLIHADEFAAKMLLRLNWERIELRMKNLLGENSTRAAICEELDSLSERFRTYLQTPEVRADIDRLLASGITRTEELLRKWLQEQIPEIINNCIENEELWKNVDSKLLPMIQSFVLHRLKHDRDAIISGLDLPGRIEAAINRQSPREVHELVNKVSGKHLIVLQLLGYVLGIIAGGMLVMANN